MRSQKRQLNHVAVVLAQVGRQQGFDPIRLGGGEGVPLGAVMLRLPPFLLMVLTDVMEP